MAASSSKKSESGRAFETVAQFFGQAQTLFASMPASRARQLITKQMKASLEALAHAPVGELAAVIGILSEMSVEISRMLALADVSADTKTDTEPEQKQ